MINTIILLTMFINIIKAEGYYCPYTDLGATNENEMLYDYYSGDSNQGYWTRIGQTGWTSRTSYCSDKGDLSKHSDAGEWKCNDSYGNCEWNASAGTCDVVTTREPDCRTLCEAVLNNQGPECLGNCPGGSQSNTLYDICSTIEQTITTEIPTNTNTQVIEETVYVDPTTTILATTTPVVDRIIRMNGRCYIKNEL